MSLNEFEVIRRFFTRPGAAAPDVVLGVGDDAAIVRLNPGQVLVVASDVLNEGVHFPTSTDAHAIGHKALAVNLSDLAAMGASPSWFTMTLSLPAIDEDWLTAFSRGLFEIADRHGITLVGGDTVRGPLSVGMQVLGQVADGAGLRRDGACTGDLIYVSGTIGDAALALQQIKQGTQPAPRLQQRLDYPEPRVELGERLVGVASSCIDLSDGLIADLGHVLDASGKGARILAGSVPVSGFIRELAADSARHLVLAGGDDYELCFTATADSQVDIERIGKELQIPIACIGEIIDGAGLEIGDVQGQWRGSGFDHFSGRES